MHGWRGAEECDGRRRRLVRLMWPAARVEAEAPPPPAQGLPTSPSSSSVPPSRTTSYPPESAARKQDFVDSPRPVSPDSFIKVRFFVGFRLGICLLTFTGLIRLRVLALSNHHLSSFFVSTWAIPAI
jgi:hypothetical protein